MGLVELHFFHGFLGNPADWQSVVENISTQFNHTTVFHDLLEDSKKLKSSLSFESWTRLKEKELFASESKKILIGYSMGGRQLMHLPERCFEKLILLGAHPGLLEGHETRAAWDRKWIDQFRNSSVDAWLEEWNSQPVFANDLNRPKRNLSKSELKDYLNILDQFSLSRQSAKDEHLQCIGSQVYWAYGKKDKKFKDLASRMSHILPQENISNIDQSGHGVIFDQPKLVGSWISEVASDVR